MAVSDNPYRSAPSWGGVTASGPAGAPAFVPAGKYITTQGDTWDVIAFKLWGKERLYHALIEANPDERDILVFPAGTVLTVPARPDTASRMELPPWMA